MMYKGELSFHRTWFDYDLELVWIFSCTLDVKNYSHRFPSALEYENSTQLIFLSYSFYHLSLN